jgi:ferritin-like metal-binding protein YciE
MATIQEQLVKYLTDAHGLEEQSLNNLRNAASSADDPRLEQMITAHIAETERHQVLIRGLLETHGASPSAVKDTGNAAIAVGKKVLETARPDNAGKNARDCYIGEATEIASYELLKAVAVRAADEQVIAVAEEILREERAMLAQLETTWDHAALLSLQAEGVGP